MRKEFKLEAVAINSAHDENLNTVLEVRHSRLTESIQLTFS